MPGNVVRDIKLVLEMSQENPLVCQKKQMFFSEVFHCRLEFNLLCSQSSLV